MRNRNHVIISVNGEKAFGTIQHSFQIKTLNKLEREGNYFNIIKSICEEHTVNIMLNSDRLKAFPLRSGSRQDACSCNFEAKQLDKKKK